MRRDNDLKEVYVQGKWRPIMASDVVTIDPTKTDDYVLEWYCSRCHNNPLYDENHEEFLSEFCPYCGAKMLGRA